LGDSIVFLAITASFLVSEVSTFGALGIAKIPLTLILALFLGGMGGMLNYYYRRAA